MNPTCRSCGLTLESGDDQGGCPACMLRTGLMSLDGPVEKASASPRPGDRVDAMAPHRLAESLARFAAALRSGTSSGSPSGDVSASAASFEAARSRIPVHLQVVALPPDIAWLWSPSGSGRIVALGDGGSLSHWSLSDREPVVTGDSSDRTVLKPFPSGETLLAHGRGRSNINILHWMGAPPGGGTLSLPVSAPVLDAALSPDRRSIAVAMDKNPRRPSN